jgi:hypothetical protein
MKRVRLGRPTPALVISILALFIALGGTVYAASKISGKSIKPNSIPANRLKKHSLSGKQINLTKLGTVPTATNAANATNATNATNAANATNATNLAGLTRFRTTIPPSGTTEINANQVTLYTDGPLSLIGKCWSPSAGEITAQAYLRSSVAAHWSAYDNSTANTNDTLVPGTDQPALEDEVEATLPAQAFDDPMDGTFAALTDDRSAYFTGLGSAGVNIGGSGGCTFAGYGISS